MRDNDWDFPCSEAYRGAEAELNEGIRLERSTPIEPEDYEPFSVVVSPLPKDIEQMKAELSYLRRKLDGHMDPSREKKGGYEI